MANKSEGRRPSILREIVIIALSVFLSAFLGAGLGSYFQARKETDFRKYELMTEFQCRTAELVNQAAFLADSLVNKYGLDQVKDGNIPEVELAELKGVIEGLNNQLSKMYLIMPDDKYGRIIEAIPIDDVDKLKNVRSRILIEMRKAQFKKTKYTDPNDIRRFKLK